MEHKNGHFWKANSIKRLIQMCEESGNYSSAAEYFGITCQAARDAYIRNTGRKIKTVWKPTIEEYQSIKSLRDAGLSWMSIGAQFNQPDATIRARFKRLCLQFSNTNEVII